MGAGRRRGPIYHVGGGSEALGPIQGGGVGKFLELTLIYIRGKVGVDKNEGDGGGGALMVAGAVEGTLMIRGTT